MNRLHKVFLRAWLGPRAYWALAAIAAAFAAGALAGPLLWIAFAASALFLAAFAADAAIGPSRSQIEIERLEPDPFALRSPAELRYRIRNADPRAVRAGIIEGPCALLRFDVDETTASVAGKSEAIIASPVTPVARGTLQLGELFVWYENAIGLIRRRMRVPAGGEVRVYPDLSAVERYGTLNARNRIIEAGLRRLRLRGAGTELESVRDWSDGDPFRAINWKATARRGRVMVTQYEVERSQNVMILLDAGRLMTPRVDEQRKFDYAVTAAMSVASVAALANDKVGVVAFAGAILRACAPRATGGSLARVAAEIHDVEPRFEETDYAQAFAYVRTHVRKRSLIVFFTDMVDPVAQSTVLAQIRLLSRRHLVVCAFMNDAAIDRALAAEPRTTTGVYAAGVALELQEERRTASAVLTRLGVRVIDVPARELTTALIDQYLQIKQRGLL